ncbi:histidine kinase dimerization/phospho-acceptor domain-containing protein [Sphingomonas chungangi]|uniref:histidine kinase dimerization/phospho-acceptor domain-containing protein n=1 Tax=Sphingomonas chungangi TaxID=2683589 RepID=UPI0013607E55|nr:sensor histidine kinase [Sphingomonas chungangi]
MRFDDMLATVLARPAERPADRVAQWRQLLDLLAQHRPGSDPGVARRALARLQDLRRDVPVAIRRETASAFAGRALPAPLVVFLSADVPVVASAMLGHVRLSEADWLVVLPRLSPTGRGVLRHRRDLGIRVEQALTAFGRTDLALHGVSGVGVEADPATVEEARPPVVETSLAPIAESENEVVDLEESVEPLAAEQEASAAREPEAAMPAVPIQALEHGAGEGQIRAIIDRIAGFRQRREDTPATEPEAHRVPDSFRFETGSDGVIRWVDGMPRGPLIGETIATAASGPIGVDAQAPGAFRRRATFRDARLTVAGGSEAAGEWRIAGVPVFAPDTGRFQGYRGTARRPRTEERAESASLGLYGVGLEPDSLRQLVHELRTPLNAIGGFAEMIRRQMRGPVSTAYRERAQEIAEQAGRLLAAVDDLDVAARLETQRLDLQRVEVDLGAMVQLVCGNHAESARHRGATLACDIGRAPLSVQGDPAALRRMIGRLVGGVAALAGKGEAVRVDLRPVSEDAVMLRVDRPTRIADLPETTLLDPGFGPDGDAPDAPLLGLGFTLHLVRRLAATVGGTLSIEPGCLVLRLPTEASAEHAGTGG